MKLFFHIRRTSLTDYCHCVQKLFFFFSYRVFQRARPFYFPAAHRLEVGEKLDFQLYSSHFGWRYFYTSPLIKRSLAQFVFVLMGVKENEKKSSAPSSCASLGSFDIFGNIGRMLGRRGIDANRRLLFSGIR
ncbi:hypothetical protein Zmor_001876 [Zophobas morio]|uniref:Uncharacterized protein n=1 Tax=Zophobas morio TaxID=2755281 RepID=A0AA38JA47_9CUCU|nr:hypothetical protein Zmor_001876 [Zophobas morio]